MMKELLFNDESRQKMIAAVNKLAEAKIAQKGARGQNIVLDKAYGANIKSIDAPCYSTRSAWSDDGHPRTPIIPPRLGPRGVNILRYARLFNARRTIPDPHATKELTSQVESSHTMGYK